MFLRLPSPSLLVGTASSSITLLLSLGLLLSHFPTPVQSNAGVFSYYDDEFRAPGSSELLQVGPASWRKLLIQNNQCGGAGQRSGYGQSPVVIPRSAADTCSTDLSGYQFEGGTCAFDDLNFRIVTNGVIVGPDPFGNGCSLGRMKIPGNDNWYDALQFHIHTSSEHSVDGKYHPAELHVVHREETAASFAVFGMFIDKHDENQDADADKENATDNANQDKGHHQVFENYLKGWESRALQSEELCAARPSGTGVFTPNRLFTSRQQRMTCPAVGAGVTQDDVKNLEWYDETTLLNPQTGATVTARVPVIKSPDFPQGPIPEIYSSLPTDPNFGMYTYRGGLTTPPCTEIVRWNLLDGPMIVSQNQLDRLYSLILCFVERSTCRHATVASIFGTTNRPPQALNGRTITHRCKDKPSSELVIDPVAPAVASYTLPPPIQPWMAVLYPWFVMALGFVTFYLLSRYAHAIPYTAVMFILGTCTGIGVVLLQNTDQLTNSARMWGNINSELLLLVFLPGLLFRDAFSLNVHLLKDALVQCLIMAFPMVLAGTALLAVVGFYVLPYGWSFSLSMTFGAILSATDPVAVSALLNEVGAPPRLKVHIAGESLLNDGSAIVFYTLFASKFLYEQGIPGLGRNIDAAQGVALFFRMSLGAVAIGLGFGLALVRILHMFKRRFSSEESVVQVTSTITVAYLTYYVADAVCLTSGVIAVVTCGIVTKTFGVNLINDKIMMEKFWVLVEHLLNTLIFSLGGVVWGTIISNADPRRSETFSGQDWGYLFLVYVLIMAIRVFLFVVFFPIISRIGLKTNWKEVLFISFGGLRGAVGIALSIALDNELRRDTVPGDPRRDFTSQLFGLTGGISFLTLIINGTACGPLLRRLGPADLGETREKIVAQYRHGLMQHVLDKLLEQLSDPQYAKVDFDTIQKHVPALKGITGDELKLAVKRQKTNQEISWTNTPSYEYKKPNLESFRGVLKNHEVDDAIAHAEVSSSVMLKSLVERAAMSFGDQDGEEEVDEREVLELRKLFVELLRKAYDYQIDHGMVDVREGHVVFGLERSLEQSADAVANGEPLCDWEKLQSLNDYWERRTAEVLEMDTQVIRRASVMSLASSRRSLRASTVMADDEQQKQKEKRRSKRRSSVLDVQEMRANMREAQRVRAEKDQQKANVHEIQRTVAFVEAHQIAQKAFKDKFCGNRLLTAAERKVLNESREQEGKAEELLKRKGSAEVHSVVSHLLCTILLNAAALYIGDLVEQGILKEMEGEEYIHEHVEHELKAVAQCVKHKGCRIIEEDNNLDMNEEGPPGVAEDTNLDMVEEGPPSGGVDTFSENY